MRVPEGFEAFFAEHHDGVVRALTLVFGDRPAAEDAAQVGFERAYARWHRVGSYTRPGTWVYVVALRHGRSQLREREVVGPATDGVASDQTQALVDRLAIVDHVLALPAQQRAVVVLRHLAGLQLSEIAQAMGIRVGTVKSTLHAAHSRLRVAMELGAEDREVRDAH
ncbi:MAG: RNA polymerase sigma factor [Acidimicrobiales bacterium]